ncbi:MAG: hypothetical protein DRQ42_00140 [Gammaproteobacteria bacterium]|nr:MAG: hypothetical protein DRQ42_00140 [Gammaproteobacteria bacterium]
MNDKSTEERRRDCHDCVSHREHSKAISTLEKHSDTTTAEQGDMWKALDSRVSYGNFKWGIGIIMSLITIVSGINYYTSKAATTANYETMNRILESNHQVEKGLIVVESEIKSINEKLVIFNAEHVHFRSALLKLMHNNVKNNGKPYE